MKYLIGLMLAIIPFCAFGGNFVYHEYQEYDNEYWYDEYWNDPYWCDGYWVYYPHGYYCVHYVWWYPWWWDYYWWRCHWCHNFCWDFYYCGFYVVWYESGCWWYRPRYGRWVRYRVPYSYEEIRHNSQMHGITLPPKPPREINVPYKEQEIMKLSRDKDPELFKQVEKEKSSGNLEKMRNEYDAGVKKEIAKKNLEYKNEKNVSQQKSNYATPPVKGSNASSIPYKTPEKKIVKNPSAGNDIKAKSPASKTPGAAKPEYDQPDKKDYYNDGEKEKSRTKNDDNVDREKTPTYTKPDAGRNSVMKNPYTKPNDDRKNVDQGTDRKAVPNTKR